MSARSRPRLQALCRRGPVLTGVLLLLGLQLVGGSLHAATAGHGPAADCPLCLAQDRLDHGVAAAPLPSISPAPAADAAAPLAKTSPRRTERPYRARAPPRHASP